MYILILLFCIYCFPISFYLLFFLYSGFSIVKHTSCNNIESSSVSSNTNILCNDLKKTNISKSSFEILSIIYNDNRTEYDDDSWEDDDDDDDEEENDDDKDVEDKCEVA